MAEFERDEIVELSSLLIRLNKLFDKGQSGVGAYIDDATVTATVYDTDGVTELLYFDDADPGWPLSLVYISGTRGQYDITVIKPLKVVVGETYKVVIDAIRPSGVRRRFIKHVPASAT